MSDSADELASWASILGSVVALLGLFQSQTWLAAAGICFAALSVGAIIYARRGQRRLQSAAVHIEGLNLDSLNIANLRRRLNRSLVVQRAIHLAKIDGQGLSIAWQYDGYCRSKRETSMEFSIDTENNVPFEQLDCFAFDLREDAGCQHKIRPMLIGADGLSKKIAVPFLKPVLNQQPFSLLLSCNLPGSSRPGIKYYTSSLSFDQRYVDRLVVHLIFGGTAPEWMRVYECDKPGRATLISELRPVRADADACEYIDIAERIPGRSVRIYVYQLGAAEFPPGLSGRKLLD